jgi:intracellular septation protein
MLKKLFIGLSIEFGPIVVFFLTAPKMGFMPSTGLFVALTAISLGYAFIMERRVAYFPLIAGLSVILSGVATLTFNEPLFLIVKDTIYNGAFAIVLIAGLLKGKGLLKPLFKSLFAMNDTGWKILSHRWAILFILLAVGNEIVWRNYDEITWVAYKGYSTFVTIIFAVYQFRLSKEYRLPDSNAWGMKKGA